MNIEEVEEPKKYENLQTKPVLDPFKSTADHLKVRELARKTNIEEVEEPETTKIYRQNPLTPAAATRKLREFTDETNMQARKHENSDEFCAPPVRHLDLATRPFTLTVRNPKCYHTVWGKTLESGLLLFSGIQREIIFKTFDHSFFIFLLADYFKMQLLFWRHLLHITKWPCHFATLDYNHSEC